MAHDSIPHAQPSRIVIIGASLAGGTAGIALRDQGYEGELTVIGEESQLPYERPPLSKALLLGERNEPDWVGDEATYADKAISLRLGTTPRGSTEAARSWWRAAMNILRQAAYRDRIGAAAAGRTRLGVGQATHAADARRVPLRFGAVY